MESSLFVFLYLLVPTISYKVLRLARIEPFSISIPSIFFWYYLAVAYMGLLPLYFGWNEHWYAQIGPDDSDRVLTVFFYSASTLLFSTIGFFFASRLRGSKIAARWNLPQALHKNVNVALLVLVAICLGVIILYLKNFSTSALQLAISGELSDAKVLRSQMANQFTGVGRYYYYRLFFEPLLSFCVFILLSQAIIVRKIGAWFFALLALSIAIYAVMMGGEKAPLIWLMMGCFLTYLYTRKGKVEFKDIIMMFSLVCLMIVLLIYVFVGTDEVHTVTNLMLWAFHRSFIGGIIPAFFYLEIFPAYHDFLWGTSLPNPRNILPFESYPITTEVMQYMHGGAGDVNVVGSAPTAFWAGIYANFGPFSPLLVAPLVGIAIYLVHIFFGQFRASPIKTALIVWSALHIMMLAETDIGKYLLDEAFVLIVAVATFLMIVDRQIRLRIN